MRLKWSLFSLLCGLCVTPGAMAAAPAKEWNDTVHALRATPSTLQIELANAAPVVLAYLYLPTPELAAKSLASLADAPVVVRNMGLDRYGNAQVILRRVNAASSVQEQLLREGMALVYSGVAFPESAAWLRAESDAARNQRGIWKGAAAAKLGLVANPSNAAQFMQHFVQVTGRVTRTYHARDAYYINFGEDWKTDFSVKIPRKAWRSFGEQMNVAPGDTVAARGVVISENGPMIVITRPEQRKVTHAQP